MYITKYQNDFPLIKPQLSISYAEQHKKKKKKKKSLNTNIKYIVNDRVKDVNEDGIYMISELDLQN